MSSNVTEDLATLSYAAQEALNWLREVDREDYTIPEYVTERLNWARSNLMILSESLSMLEKKSKGEMS